MHENEILVFLLGTVVWAFIALYRQRLQGLPALGWLFASYAALWGAWLATNLEHLWFAQLFNLVEHAGYALNGLLLLVWCWCTMTGAKELRHD